MASSAENELYGITPRAVYQIFNIFKDFERNGTKWKLNLSYIEIYNEKNKMLINFISFEKMKTTIFYSRYLPNSLLDEYIIFK